MKKILMCVIILGVLVSIPSTVFAFSVKENFSMDTDLAERVEFGIKTSAVFFRDSNLDETGFNAMANVSYDIYKWLAVGLESGWTFCKVGNDNLGSPNINIIPLLGDIIIKPFHYELGYDAKLVPYAIVGLGGYFNFVTNDEELWKSDIDSSFAHKYGAGIDVFANRNLALNLEIAYVFSSTTLRATPDGGSQNSEKIDLDGLYLGGGVKGKW